MNERFLCRVKNLIVGDGLQITVNGSPSEPSKQETRKIKGTFFFRTTLQYRKDSLLTFSYFVT